jgi:hypothetical protein
MIDSSKQPVTVPPAAEVRQRLTDALREASLLRRLLRVAEHAERLTKEPKRKAVQHAVR